MNDYEPIRIKPLRLRGVYGIAWMIYKRNFASMFLFTLMLYGIAMLVFGAVYGGSIARLTGFLESLENGGFRAYDSFGMGVDNPFQAIAGGLSLGIGLSMLMMLLGLGFSLVLQPMIHGGLFTEASARLYGKYSGLKALLRRSKFMLRRFFTTNLCLMLANWAISTVVLFVVGAFVFVGVMALTFSMMATSALSAGAIVGIVAVLLVVVAVSVMGMCFLSFVYPVAVNEGLKNFKAIERSFKIVSKRFGRVFGVSMTLVFAATLAVGLIAVVLYFLQATDWPFAMIVPFVVETALVCLCMPYVTALNTVLYFDSRVRMEGEEWLNYPEPSFSDPAVPVLDNMQPALETAQEPQQEPMNQQSDE